MPLNTSQDQSPAGTGETRPVEFRARRLIERVGEGDTGALLDTVLGSPLSGKLAVVSSFGADSVALLHLVAQRRPDTPVLFIETRMLFPETMDYQTEVARTLGLTDIRVIRATHTDLAAHDPDGTLHRTNPDACCALRKTIPLERALEGFDTWITGRKRFQTSARANLPRIETEGPRVKVNPLADWTPEEVRGHIAEAGLPPHPLVAQGYPSIGCVPCTSRVAPGEDSRAGRWRGSDKDECGIHFIDGKAVRSPKRETV
ncbi:phosphoadenylyl-sulfate reductase [Tropicimonas sp. IMCC34011]|uniref:phosphoadenylyl-sulfate reductase n=1 Tax=Tropicimonas sp. IMCC34011 TaxID=2248759 RepID=UPI000E289D39|nr:phosphoadenylyl-sulfate reductase [Tropicimonas sp. IMCC34011]